MEGTWKKLTQTRGEHADSTQKEPCLFGRPSQHKLHSVFKTLFCVFFHAIFTKCFKQFSLPEFKTKSPAVRVWKSWHRRIEERGRHLRPPSQRHSISVQFLMQIRPRWVNRHVHSYFHTMLLFYVFIECRPLYLCVNSKEGHRSFNLHVKSSDMHAKRHALI